MKERIIFILFGTLVALLISAFIGALILISNYFPDVIGYVIGLGLVSFLGFLLAKLVLD